MNDFVAGVVRAAAETFDFPEPILEVGSYVVPGQERWSSLRQHFARKQYIGIDMRPGPGVDSVENVESLPRPDQSVGSVLALNLFEHVRHFWRGFEEVQRVLRRDGLLLVSCPFHLHIHAYPDDYWRFTPQAFLTLLDRMPHKIVGYHGPAKNPLNVWVLAGGAGRAPISAAEHASFRERIARYARQPIAWQKKLRYHAGRWLCGRRPFAAFLDAERFDTRLVHQI